MSSAIDNQEKVYKMDTSSEVLMSITAWCICSVGMMVFNKVAVEEFPEACSLVVLQMAFCCIVMVIFAWKHIHIGSWRDVLRWCMVTPFFSGMLLTSVLALKNAPMSLVVVLRSCSPIVGLAIESFYPHPPKVNYRMWGSMLLMLGGSILYAWHLPHKELVGAGWAVVNAAFAVGDRLLQRLMLSAEQRPVNMSKAGVTVLNNLLGIPPILLCALVTQEWKTLPVASDISLNTYLWILASCIVGVGISYTGIWAQSLISATSFLMLINANKFAIIAIEATFFNKRLTLAQLVGAFITIVAAIMYGKAQEDTKDLKENLKDTEQEPLVKNKQSVWVALRFATVSQLACHTCDITCVTLSGTAGRGKKKNRLRCIQVQF